MKALQLTRVSGIPIRIHWTFFAFLLWIRLSEFVRMGDPLQEVFFALAVFGCILLHELGHAFAARRFGIKTKDITLYPIGGVAMLSGEAKPAHEILIAIAGPAVNVVIMLALIPFLTRVDSPPEEVTELLAMIGFADRLFFVNFVLFAFNLIPAFPMDGGRVLRAVLSILLGPAKGSAIAARVGQAFAIFFVVLGIYSNNVILTIIGIVIFSNASREAMYQQGKNIIAGRKIGELMVPVADIQLLSHGMTVQKALESTAESRQSFFPVQYGSEIIGVLSRDALLRSAGQAEDYISGLMDRTLIKAAPSDSVEELLGRIDLSVVRPILVFDKDELIGIVGIQAV